MKYSKMDFYSVASSRPITHCQISWIVSHQRTPSPLPSPPLPSPPLPSPPLPSPPLPSPPLPSPPLPSPPLPSPPLPSPPLPLSFYFELNTPQQYFQHVLHPVFPYEHLSNLFPIPKMKNKNQLCRCSPLFFISRH